MKVIFVLGPTASGKSALALALAREFGGSILNCDSVQTCRRLDVGTAKPTLLERALVPHYLFDVIGPGERLTAGDFRRLALDALKTARGPVFAVGGSGFYVRALEKGMFDVAPPKPAVERAVRARLAAEGPKALHAELERRDPGAARRLSPNDVYRVTRALIVMDDSGRTLTELRDAFTPEPFPYPYVKIGVDPGPTELRARIAKRTARMIEDGILGETRALVDEGFGEWPALASVGYRECRAVLDGRLAPERLADEISLKTAQLAKRQRTWFKRDAEIHWVSSIDEARAIAGDSGDRT